MVAGSVSHPVVRACSEMKGVWGGREYPLFALDLQHRDPVNVAFSRVRSDAVEAAGVVDLCRACSQDPAWPSALYLPDSSNSDFHELPVDSLEELRTNGKICGAETVPLVGEAGDPLEARGATRRRTVYCREFMRQGSRITGARNGNFLPCVTLKCESSTANQHADGRTSLSPGSRGRGPFVDPGRLDALLISNRITGFELKSAADSLVRLPRQVAAYNAVVERAVLVLAPRHLDSGLRLAPPWWGIWVAREHATGIRLQRLRAGTQNPAPDALALLTFVPRHTLISELRARGHRDLGGARSMISARTLGQP